MADRDAEQERASLAVWTLTAHHQDLDPYWCTLTEAGRLLGISGEAVSQLVYRRAVFPAHTTPTGRILLKRADVVWAAANAGPPGSFGRWAAVKAHLMPTQTMQPTRQRRPTACQHPQATRVAGLPWPELVSDYQSGTSVRQLADQLELNIETVRRYLRRHGATLTNGARRKQLPIDDAELRRRHAAGDTLTDLADECHVSTALIWRRINFTTDDTDSADSDDNPVERNQPEQAEEALGRRWLPVEEIAVGYRAGEGIISLARRHGCSQSGIRKALARAGVVMRPRGGVRRAVTSTEIVALRDYQRLSWTDISSRTGLTEEALRHRYETTTGRLPAQEWHRAARQRPDLTDQQLRELNSVVDHKADIVDSYLNGQVSASQLARDYGISDRTVRRWAGAERDTRR